jgi:ApeA N-terminal domain 1/Apea-like HEPN
MKEKIEFKGKWYLPSNPEDQVMGTIKFVPQEGATLELFGKFKLSKFDKFDIILGILSEGKYATLYNTFLTNFKFNTSGGFGTARYHVNYFLVGVGFEKTSELGFNKIHIHYSHLNEWLNLKGFEFNRSEDRRIVEIKYQLPEDIQIQVNPKTTITIKNSYNIPSKKQSQELGIQQFSYIQILHKRRDNFKNILKDIVHIQNLFTLFIQTPIMPSIINLFYRIGNNKSMHEVKLYYSLLKPRYLKEDLMFMDMLIPYKSISSNFENILKNWIDCREKLHTVFIPFFSNYYSPFYYASDKFLNLTRAVEAFHREAFNQRNAYFKKRVKEVLSTYSRCFNGLLKIRSKEQFAEKIKNLRNHFTHSNPLEAGMDKYSLQLHFYSERLQIILTCAILNYIGIDRNLIKEHLEKSKIYNHIRYRM